MRSSVIDGRTSSTLVCETFPVPLHSFARALKLIECFFGIEQPYGTIAPSTTLLFSIMRDLVSELATALSASVSSRTWTETV
jgi:hypothetical protein